MKITYLYFKNSVNDFTKIIFILLFISLTTIVKGQNELKKIDSLLNNRSETYQENLRNIDSAIVLAYQLEDKKILTDAYISKAVYIYEQRNYNEALKNYKTANDLSLSVKDDYLYYTTLFGIATTKAQLNETKEAISIFERCLTYFNQNKEDSKHFKKYLNTLGQLSYLNIKANNLEKSVFYNDLELKNTVDTLNYHYAIKNKGIINFYKKDYKSAFSELKESQKVFLKQQDFTWYIIAEQYLGEILYKENRVDEAINYFRNVVKLSKQKKIVNDELRLSYERLIAYNELKGNKNEQILAINDLLSFDSLYYATDNLIAKPNLEKYENTKLKFERNNLEKSNNRLKYSVIGFIVLVVLCSFCVYYFYQKKHKNRINKLLGDITKLKGSTLSLRAKSVKKEKGKSIFDDRLEASLSTFEACQLYLNPTFTLNDLVKELKSNRTIVSNYINSSRNKNFNQYINELRINYAVNRLMNEPTLKKYTIDALAEEVGFNSRKTFSDAFLEHTGCRPSRFIRNL